MTSRKSNIVNGIGVEKSQKNLKQKFIFELWISGLSSIGVVQLHIGYLVDKTKTREKLGLLLAVYSGWVPKL